MNKRLFLFGLFLATGMILMAAPARPVQPEDWVDRMIANHASALRALSGDGMVAAGVESLQPPDWIDRMIANRQMRAATPAFSTGGGVKTALGSKSETRD